jgi:hypothetical protein
VSKEWSFLKPNPELLVWDRRVNTSLNTTTDVVNISIYNGWLKAGQKKMTGVCPHHKWSLLLALFPHFEYIDHQRSMPFDHQYFDRILHFIFLRVAV